MSGGKPAAEQRPGIAVVGAGYWGPNLVRNLMASPDWDLRWLCDLDTDRAERVAAPYSSVRVTGQLDDVLADPAVTAVAIATPARTHRDVALTALRAGRHVLVEKPLAATHAEGAELVAEADERGLVLMCDHTYCYTPAVTAIRELIHSGALGEVHFVDSVRINLGLIQPDVDVLWDLAPHDLSIIDHLLDRPPKGLVATGISHSPDEVASVAHVHLDYGDILASVHVNWLSPVKIRHLLVGGSRRSVLYNDLDVSEPIKVYDRGIDRADDPEGRRAALISYRSGDVVSPNVDKAEPLMNMMNHFASCIELGTPPISGAEQGLRVVRILEAADLSLAKGGTYVDIAHG